MYSSNIQKKVKNALLLTKKNFSNKNGFLSHPEKVKIGTTLKKSLVEYSLNVIVASLDQT